MGYFRGKKSWIFGGIIFFTVLGLCIREQGINNSDENQSISKAYEHILEEESLIFPDNIEYLKSATYFSDEWPMNFWNSEFTNLQADFKQIVTDGFNSIILVIPWREFQPSIDPIIYNDRAFEKLEYIMSEAEKSGLRVVVRIGYTWDFYEDNSGNVIERFYKVMYDEKVRNAWYDYCKALYTTCSAFSNYVSGFITWEDFWCNSYLGTTLETREERTEYAQMTGYQTWLKENFKEEELREYGLSLKNIAEVGIPCSDDADMVLWYEYIDGFFVEILSESQKYFPNLSMEVRTDWDVYKDKDGVSQYVQHYSTFNCSDSRFTTVMYGIPQGCENKGEKLHYTEAMEKTEYILQGILEHNDGKPVYVDQFIFADNTQGFEMNAQLYEEEIDEYLMNVGDVLNENTCGYGVWTYQDYAANLLYNPQFGEREAGWEIIKGEIVENESNYSLLILPEGKLSQKLPSERNHYTGSNYIVSFDVYVENSTMINITLGDAMSTVEVAQSGKVELELQTKNPLYFSVKTDSEIEIDNIKIYNFVQEGFLYNLDGEEEIAIEAMRILNSFDIEEDLNN